MVRWVAVMCAPLLLAGCGREGDVPGFSIGLPVPFVRGVALAPDAPATDATVSATVAVSAGTLAFSWAVDGVAVAATGPTLDGSFFAKGQVVTVTVTATLDGRVSEPATATVDIVNTPPTAPTVEIEAGSDGYTCAVTTPSADADGDAITYTTVWAADGIAYGGALLPMDESARAAAWTCTGTPADDEADGAPGSATITLEGPVEGGYSFTRVSDVVMPDDVVALADGSLLVTTLLGDLVHVDPATGETLGEATLYESDDLVSLALDPRFGDGTHDWVYTWTNHTCVLARHRLTLDPFTVSDTQVLTTMSCPIAGGHAGGDLLWWAGEGGEPVLYLGIGPTLGANPQEQVEPGQKLLAFSVADDGTIAPGVAGPFDNPYIVALGLRNPWRLADCGVGICLADAGSEYFEEVNLYTGAGMNFGYPRVEGPDTGGSRFDDPALWWEDDDPANAEADRDGPGRTGFVNAPTIGVRVSATGYAGRLADILLYADVYDGWIRGAPLDDTGAVGAAVPIATLPYVLAMTEAPDGTVWAVSLAGGLWRLDYRADRPRVGEPGDRLSDAAPGGIAYSVRYPLWSNGADKARWIEIPAGETIDTTDPDAWVFPEGTRLWKQFAVDGLPVETRLLEKRDGAWLAGTYVWDGDDAYLTDGTRQSLVLPSGEPYTVPSQFACFLCHSAALGHDVPLGPEPFQLGDEGLATLAPVLDTPPGPAPQLDVADPAEAAIRGWLHGNCSFCHQPAGVVSRVSVVALDFRYSATDTGLTTTHAEYWNANPNSDNGLPLVVAGDPDSSALVGILEAGDMPPVAVWQPDTATIADIRAWIAAMP